MTKKNRITDLTVQFQKDVVRNDGLIGYKTLKINSSKERFRNAAVKGPCIVK